MSGPGEGKIKITANAYIHEKGKSLARITHLDLESDDISRIIKPGETTFVKGKPGGVFIALKKEMIKRAEKLIEKNVHKGMEPLKPLAGKEKGKGLWQDSDACSADGKGSQ